jgi:hypothetical protein
LGFGIRAYLETFSSLLHPAVCPEPPEGLIKNILTNRNNYTVTSSTRRTSKRIKLLFSYFCFSPAAFKEISFVFKGSIKEANIRNNTNHPIRT